MLNYKFLDIEYKHVSEKILEYINTNNIKLNSTNFWHKVDNSHFFNTIPELQQMFDPLNLTVRDVGILAANITTTIHVDKGDPNIFEEPIRINFPISNCENTTTNFYHSEAKGIVTTLPNGSVYTYFDPVKCKLIDSYVLTKPTVLRVNVPHRVYIPNTKLMRIACTVFFKENIEYLLNE